MKAAALFVSLALATGSCLAAVEANTATEAELDSVKGLGPASTARIMKAREQKPFKDWSDFTRRVKGIKPAAAAKLSDAGLTVNQTSYTSPKAP